MPCSPWTFLSPLRHSLALTPPTTPLPFYATPPKVDGGLFEQQPAAQEPAKATLADGAAAAETASAAAVVAAEPDKPSSSSRFAYDTLTAQVCMCINWQGGCYG